MRCTVATFDPYGMRTLVVDAPPRRQQCRRSELQQHGPRRPAGRARDRACVEIDLTAVLLQAARQLDVGLEVDDRPAVWLLERGVDAALDERAVVEAERERRLARDPCGASGATEQWMCERSRDAGDGGADLVSRRLDEACFDRGHLRDVGRGCVEVDGS